jgi:colanic acid/amylovoran biosynthesis glycosyltransferase
MRLVYLVSEYPQIRHSYLLREIRGLRKLGWDITVLAIRPDSRSVAECTVEEREEQAITDYVLKWSLATFLRAHLHTLARRPGGYLQGLLTALRYGRLHPERTMYGLIYFAEAVAIGRWIKLRDLVHVHTHYASTVAWMMSSVFGIPISMTIHGSGEFDDVAGFRLREKVAISQFVIAISYFGRSQLMRATPESQWGKIQICRLGVEPHRYLPRPFRSDPQPFELLCVGGMALPRSFHLLVQAIAGLKSEGRNVVLRLVGDGPDRAALERLADELGVANRVTFEGWRNQDQVREFFQRADLFVFSSFAEGIPVVLMEAMAMGIPCVASRIAGIPELIRDGLDGFLAAASDDQAIVRAVARLMDDAELRRRMGEAAREHIEAEYNLENNIDVLAEIFSQRLAS